MYRESWVCSKWLLWREWICELVQMLHSFGGELISSKVGCWTRPWYSLQVEETSAKCGRSDRLPCACRKTVVPASVESIRQTGKGDCRERGGLREHHHRGLALWQGNQWQTSSNYSLLGRALKGLANAFQIVSIKKKNPVGGTRDFWIWRPPDQNFMHQVRRGLAPRRSMYGVFISICSL